MRQLAKLLNWKFRFRGFESRPHRQSPRPPRAPMPEPRSTRLLVAAGALCAAAAWGCAVDRRLKVETEPSGAEVIVDGKVLGQAPLEVHFTHYGARLIRAELRGETGRSLAAQIEVDLQPPWYGAFPFDLFSEIVFPVWRTDFHAVSLRLEPGGSAPAVAGDPASRDAAALDRAKALRRWTPGEALWDIPASAPAAAESGPARP